jgi:hypothetical protein
LQTIVESAGKNDNYAKEFQKKVRQEEKRLLQLLDEEEVERFVLVAH